ncbi:MAG: MFS transporter [Gammaproteobacteria bacterium]|nr:MFS transporter [Gammaproteobacteria bacterium]
MTDKANRFGPFWLQPGVTAGNMLTLFAGAYSTIGLLTFIALSTPYVLTVYLQVPQGEQGAVSGYLHTFQEVIAIAVFGPLGVLADRIGRRAVYVGGLVLMGIAYALYSYATSLPELYVYRFVYAVGIAAGTGMLGTIGPDYTEERSRGIAVAFTGILNALGVITVTIGLGKLPHFFVERGASQEAAGHDAHFVVAGLCFAFALLLAVGLKGGTVVARTERLPVRELFRSGLAEAQANPRIALSYVCAFIARSDLVLLGTYSVLWGTTAAAAQGMDAAQSLAEGRKVFATASFAALLWLFVIGFVLDRVNRVTGIIVCMTIACAGYLGTMLIDDPLSTTAIPLLVLLGIGQISAFAGAQTLISKEAAQANRGSVIGMFNMFGAVGILVSTFVGGILFDSVGPHAPFVFVGVLTLGLIAAAVVCRIKAPGPLSDRGVATAVALH